MGHPDVGVASGVDLGGQDQAVGGEAVGGGFGFDGGEDVGGEGWGFGEDPEGFVVGAAEHGPGVVGAEGEDPILAPKGPEASMSPALVRQASTSRSWVGL